MGAVTRAGSQGRTVLPATLAGIAPSSHRAASAYGRPALRSDAATSWRSNQGWAASSRTKVWPTAPVAPRTATGQRIDGVRPVGALMT
jgi:hypothetical protein